MRTYLYRSVDEVRTIQNIRCDLDFLDRYGSFMSRQSFDSNILKLTSEPFHDGKLEGFSNDPVSLKRIQGPFDSELHSENRTYLDRYLTMLIQVANVFQIDTNSCVITYTRLDPCFPTQYEQFVKTLIYKTSRYEVMTDEASREAFETYIMNKVKSDSTNVIISFANKGLCVLEKVEGQIQGTYYPYTLKDYIRHDPTHPHRCRTPTFPSETVGVPTDPPLTAGQ